MSFAFHCAAMVTDAILTCLDKEYADYFDEPYTVTTDYSGDLDEMISSSAVTLEDGVYYDCGQCFGYVTQDVESNFDPKIGGCASSDDTDIEAESSSTTVVEEEEEVEEVTMCALKKVTVHKKDLKDSKKAGYHRHRQESHGDRRGRELVQNRDGRP